MERAEAEAIYEQGREVVVAVLLRMDEQIQQLTAQVARQEQRIFKQEERIKAYEASHPAVVETTASI